jgi:two-component system, NarL family, response regulator NreC
MMTSRIRILLVDDHTVLRAGLRLLLSQEDDLDVVGEAANGREAVEMARRDRPDVVVMDLTMPVMDGFEATRQIRRELPETRVLVLTMHDSQEYLFRVLETGGSGYVPKRAADTELIGAIRAVAGDDAFLTVGSYQRLAEDYLARVRRGEEMNKFDRLTEREQEVLQKIAAGYTNQEIASQLVISVKTVETHRAHILDKLDLHTRADLVAYALRHGLLESELSADGPAPSIDASAPPAATPQRSGGTMESDIRRFDRASATVEVR